MQIPQETRERFLESVLKNFAEYGFNYRSVIDEDGEASHGLTIERTVEEAFALDMCHLTVTHTGQRARKVGLLVVNEADAAPMDLIVDFGAANANDLEIATRCIQGGSSA